MKKVLKSFSLVGLIFTFFFASHANVVAAENVDVQYRTHVEKEGWHPFVSNGLMSGTEGKYRRLEGIEVALPDGVNGGVSYRTHVQSYGWMGWVNDGAMSGTTGQAKRLEAIELKLTGEVANTHDIYYRVHVQSLGWLDWAKNGQPAGSAGFAYRLEGIKILVLPKGSPAPGPTTQTFVEYVKPAPAMKVNYTTHVQSHGWQKSVSDGATAGTSGQAKRLEGIRINISNPKYSGGIRYQTHIQSIGWQGWKANNDMSGTSGQAKRLEAIRIELTGDLARHYDIYYRVHAQSFGWMGWAKNGQSAGTAGYAYRLEAIQIRLVPIGSAAPGSTANAFREYVYVPPVNPQPNPGTVYVDANGNGMIKGSEAYIYHIPGSRYYNQTKKVIRWFKTTSEAEKAGFRAPE